MIHTITLTFEELFELKFTLAKLIDAIEPLPEEMQNGIGDARFCYRSATSISLTERDAQELKSVLEKIKQSVPVTPF